jgi:hypothetical protein
MPLLHCNSPYPSYSVSSLIPFPTLFLEHDSKCLSHLSTLRILAFSILLASSENRSNNSTFGFQLTYGVSTTSDPQTYIRMSSTTVPQYTQMFNFTGNLLSNKFWWNTSVEGLQDGTYLLTTSASFFSCPGDSVDCKYPIPITRSLPLHLHVDALPPFTSLPSFIFVTDADFSPHRYLLDGSLPSRSRRLHPRQHNWKHGLRQQHSHQRGNVRLHCPQIREK